MESSIGGAGGGSICTNEATLDPSHVRKPTIVMGAPQRPGFAVLEVAQAIQLCLWRFEQGDPVEVDIRYPNGRIAELVGYPPGSRPCDPICASHVDWAAVSGDPLGDYKVTAVQGHLQALGTIRVVRSTERRILVLGNGTDEQEYQRYKRGQTIQVTAAGYQPQAGVQLLMYYTPKQRLQNGVMLQFRTWVQLRTDPQGGAVYHLHTAADDPQGCYALDTRPAPETPGRYSAPDGDYVASKDTAPLFCLT